MTHQERRSLRSRSMGSVRAFWIAFISGALLFVIFELTVEISPPLEAGIMLFSVVVFVFVLRSSEVLFQQQSAKLSRTIDRDLEKWESRSMSGYSENSSALPTPDLHNLQAQIAQLGEDVKQLQKRREPTSIDRWVYALIVLFITAFFVALAARIYLDYDHQNNRHYVNTFLGEPLSEREAAVIDQARDVLDRAEATQASAERVLSFLEGASVLIGGALAIAAIYGLRNTQELRNDMDKESEKIARQYERVEKLGDKLETGLASIETQQQEARKKAGELFSKTSGQVDNLELTIADLLEAHQDLRNKNYQQAYDAVRRVLRRDPSNIEARHISGWLKLQHLSVSEIDGVPTLDSGIDDLEHAYEMALAINSPRPAIAATLGLLLRRKAVRSEGITRAKLFKRAEHLLLDALDDNFRLLDLSYESFWGPVAGLRRDQNDRDGAIEAYTNAVTVTPGSTYPRGNLAALHLDRYREFDDEHDRQKAMAHFRRTFELAQARLTVSPGDYYLMMDTSMAHMLRARDPENDIPAAKVFQEAHARLAEAFDLAQSPEMLTTSKSGWAFLRDACPEDWQDVSDNLQAALRKIDAEIARMKGAPDADPAPG